MRPRSSSLKLVLDWDGTVTETDGLHLVLLEFGDERIYDAAENRLGRELTLNEVIALEFESVRAPLDEVVEWMREHVRVRPGFAELARAHDPLIVSSGFHELIEPMLEREGVELEVRGEPARRRVPTAGARVSASRPTAPSAASRASASTSPGSTASCTRATGSPTAASRSRRHASSRATGSRAYLDARASRSSRSRTSTTSLRALRS